MNHFDELVNNWIYGYADHPSAAPQHQMMQQTPQVYQGPMVNPAGPSDAGMPAGDGMLARGFQRPGMFSPARQIDAAVVVRPIRYF